MSTTGTFAKWDPKNLEIRTIAVERALEPLVIQVTQLVNSRDRPSNKRKGRSKRPTVLVAAVERATQQFIAQGEIIAADADECIRGKLLETLEKIKQDGDTMARAAREFATDPLSAMKRATMVRNARALLASVTRLLTLADEVDVLNLLKRLALVKDALMRIKNSNNPNDLEEAFKNLGPIWTSTDPQLAERQNILKDPLRRDDLARARGDVKKNIAPLYTASQAYLAHPNVASAKANRDAVINTIDDAIERIKATILAQEPRRPDPVDPTLANDMDKLDDIIDVQPMKFEEHHHRPTMEDRLEKIVGAAAGIADLGCTRRDRRDRIVAECNNVRAALQELLGEYINNAGKPTRNATLANALEDMVGKNKDLKRVLRRAVMDHVSDNFIKTNVPLLCLIEAAMGGKEDQVKLYAKVFKEHAGKLGEVARLACEMSTNEEGKKMVKLAVEQLEQLCPQVINAAIILATRPDSKIAQDNMFVFRDTWTRQVEILTQAVDEITTIDDFLAVSEQHILEDITKCVQALQEKDADTLDKFAGLITGRVKRVCGVVEAEMDNYEPDPATQRCRELAQYLKDKIMPIFAERVEAIWDAIENGKLDTIDENEFIESSRMVFDGVHDIRRAVLQVRTWDDLSLTGSINGESESGFSYSTISKSETDPNNPKNAYKFVNEEQKLEIKQEIEEFKSEKEKFHRQVECYDEQSNDIIVLAKKMCLIMMQMTDFTRGTGPLKTTGDVIAAAQKIASYGKQLNELAQQIAEACPDMSTQHDLQAYLSKIIALSHQLTMCAQVKAEVQQIAGEMVVSGVDGATSLIQAAKNLMSAVVSSVKYSYVASTQAKRAGENRGPIIVWRMKAPEKKKLVTKDKGGAKPVKRGHSKRDQRMSEDLQNYQPRPVNGQM